jgi:hypothetical protein
MMKSATSPLFLRSVLTKRRYGNLLYIERESSADPNNLAITTRVFDECFLPAVLDQPSQVWHNVFGARQDYEIGWWNASSTNNLLLLELRLDPAPTNNCTHQPEAGEQHCIGFGFGYYTCHQCAGNPVLAENIRI